MPTSRWTSPRHRVRRDGEPVALGPTEFRLLRHFLEHPGRVFTREQLLDAVWSHDPDIDARTVDVHIRRLRQAINGERPPGPHPHRPFGRLFARLSSIERAARVTKLNTAVKWHVATNS